METKKIITASEFRANQRKYFELAEQMPIYVTRAGRMPIMISVPPMDLTEQEIITIERGLEQIKRGEVKTLDVDNLWPDIP